ncbi:MAG: T9SS type A sorting domain-containing protein [Calditrichaeota bacterium]|nr:T9SS type A sorting domain-containing protein [Calditrichota bacterium]
MKKNVFLISFLLFTISAHAQINMKMDGDESDWTNDPVLIEAPNNVEGYFPAEVGAAVTDIVDVKEVKAKFVDNRIYFFIRFWGGPVWPNHAQKEVNNDMITLYRNRGYYHIILDLDNDPSTGRNTFEYYKNWMTPLGYRHLQGEQNTENIGGEIVLGLETDSGYKISHPISGKAKSIQYTGEDITYQCPLTGICSPIYSFNYHVPDPDTVKQVSWTGALYDMVLNENVWVGHGWGYDFLEMGCEVTPLVKYWHDKGFDYFQPGDTIGLAAFIETPIDDWGIDMTQRGELVVPPLPKRPANIVFDGDDSDWADKPVIIHAPDNVEGCFPREVGAAINDIVDIKEVKAFVNADEDALYFLIRFWGGPVWPNYSLIKNDPNYGTIYRHRGYYSLMLDLDNNRETGWDTRYYETHLTPLGYRWSQGMENTDYIGAETDFWVGLYVNWSAPHPDNGRVRYIEYYSDNTIPVDVKDLDMTIFEYNVSDPDSIATMHFDGYIANDSSMAWFAHAFGYDFIECGFSLSELKTYWQNKGFDFLQPGQTIGISAMVETPIDNWGSDVTPRGEIKIPGSVKVAGNAGTSIPHKLLLYGNYPNPFNMETAIRYLLPQTEYVMVEIYNTLGRKVRTLTSARFSAGMHTIHWNGLDDFGNPVAGGIYLCVLRCKKTQIIMRMLLLK